MDKYTSLSTKKKIYRSKELSKLGLTYYRINKLIEKGDLTKLNKLGRDLQQTEYKF